MKLLITTMAASMLLCSNVSSNPANQIFKPQNKARAVPGIGFSHRPQMLSDEEVLTQVEGLKNSPCSIDKLVRIRRILSQSRNQNYSEKTQTKFNELLNITSQNCDQNNQKELSFMIGILQDSQQCSLLTNTHKEKIAQTLNNFLEKAKNAQCANLKMVAQSLNTSNTTNGYKSKIQNIIKMTRSGRGINTIPREVQSEFSAAIHDAYSNRPSDDNASLAMLKHVLTIAAGSPLLSTIKQYEVKEIFIPNVVKEMEKAKQLAENKDPKNSAEVQSKASTPDTHTS